VLSLFVDHPDRLSCVEPRGFSVGWSGQGEHVKPSLPSTLILSTVLASVVQGQVIAPAYELKNGDLLELDSLHSTDLSLFGVKLGDPQERAVQLLVKEKILGVRAEKESTFILLFDEKRPTGPMAGVRILDGRVDLMFVNKRFAEWTSGIFRLFLESENPCQSRDLFSLFYGRPGISFHCEHGNVTFEFTLP